MSSYAHRLRADFISGFGQLILTASLFALLIALAYLYLAPSIRALQTVGVFLGACIFGAACLLLAGRLEKKAMRLAATELFDLPRARALS